MFHVHFFKLDEEKKTPAEDKVYLCLMSHFVCVLIATKNTKIVLY
jgi:hypothetical protein